MKNISFAWTTPALLAGAKTVTRRDWKLDYAALWGSGDFALAYDRSPRVGGKPVGLIRLTAAPALELLAKMPDTDFEAEGYRWMGEQIQAEWRTRPPFREPKLSPANAVEIAVHGLTTPERARDAFEAWRRSGGSLWVIRFELVRRLDGLGGRFARVGHAQDKPPWAETPGWPKRAAWLVEQAQRLGECFCRGCFCRDTAACPVLCAWVEVDRAKGYGLCSSCAERLRAGNPEKEQLSGGKPRASGPTEISGTASQGKAGTASRTRSVSCGPREKDP